MSVADSDCDYPDIDPSIHLTTGLVTTTHYSQPQHHLNTSLFKYFEPPWNHSQVDDYGETQERG
jgi:hypothetical protein